MQQEINALLSRTKVKLGIFSVLLSTSVVNAQKPSLKIDTAGRSCLALYSDGSLWGWGTQYVATPNERQIAQLRPQLISTPGTAVSGTIWTSLGVASDHEFGLRSGGTLWGWGNNGDGQLGDGTTISRYAAVRITDPATAVAGTQWIQVMPVTQVTLALRSDSTLWAWGQGIGGLLGNGSTSAITQLRPKEIPVPVAFPSTHWSKVAASDSHALALLSNGTLWAWGENLQRQLGTQSNIGYVAVPTLVPTPQGVASGTRWVALAAGQDHSLALRSDGTLWAWGRNAHGQVGMGTLSLQTTPRQISLPATAASGTYWTQVAAGQEHSLALLSDGTLWAWGRNTEAQLGVNSIDDQLQPVQEFTRGRWVQIAGGETHSLALEQNSSRVYATGGLDLYRNSGQLGDGTVNGSLYFRPCLAVALPTQAAMIHPLSVFPNPARDWVQVYDVAIGTSVQLLNILGQICRSTQVGPNGVDVRGLLPGSYLLTIQPTQGVPRTVRLLLE